ncbi:hypothetical protein IWQ62_004912 [Dispira parvispora]|uniref:Integrator complex subunit 3 n=1 Tax=Dispira parvispora TaxID=1520584 RepID=A0A9W8AS02_9FUNG|nr:hypothetical protein IWQ62_004912 [Dispira parvispora]
MFLSVYCGDHPQELIRCMKTLDEAISDKTELEIHQELQEAASHSMTQHSELVNGLLCKILVDADTAKGSYQCLNAVVRDGYTLVVTQLKQFTCSLRFSSVRASIRDQLFWFLQRLTELNVAGLDGVYLNLLRQLKQGDIMSANLRLADSLLSLLDKNQAWLYRHPFVISSACFVFIRLIRDHQKAPNLRDRETRFVTGLLREKFIECCHIGRDLVLALQNVATIPEFHDFWTTLLYYPTQLNSHFSGIQQLLATPTPKMYLQSRLTFDMETKLLYILERLTWETYHRNMNWFMLRFLNTPESETLYCDIIRYICGVYHPSNAVLASDIVPRYVILGTLLRSVKSPVAASNIKLALFYDWFFYDPNVDSIMNIEPAILLMERSLDKYAFFTEILMEFLDFTVREYYPPMSSVLQAHMAMAMEDLLSKTVIKSLDIFTSCPELPPHTIDVIQRLFKAPSSDVGRLGDSTLLIGTTTLPTEASGPSLDLDQLPKPFEDTAHFIPPLDPSPVQETFAGDHPSENLGPTDWTCAIKDSSTLGLASSIDVTPYDSLDDQDVNPSIELAEETGEPGEPDDTAELAELAKDPSLWIFGSPLTELGGLLAENDLPRAVALFPEILKTYQETMVPFNVVGAALTLALRSYEFPMEEDVFVINPSFNILSSSSTTESRSLFQPPVDPDSMEMIYAICQHVWLALREETQTSPSRERVLRLLVFLSCHVEGLNSWWFLYCIQQAQIRSPYRDFEKFRAELQPYLDYAALFDTAGLSSCLVRDAQAVQDASAAVFYHIAPLLYYIFPDSTQRNTDLLHIVVSLIDQANLFMLSQHVLTGGMRMFNPSSLDECLQATFKWGTFEQLCVWQLLTTEFSGQPHAIGKITRTVIQCADPNQHAEALNGGLNLLRTVAPSAALLKILPPPDAMNPLLNFSVGVLLQWSRAWPSELLTAWREVVQSWGGGDDGALEKRHWSALYSAWRSSAFVVDTMIEYAKQIDQVWDSANHESTNGVRTATPPSNGTADPRNGNTTATLESSGTIPSIESNAWMDTRELVLHQDNSENDSSSSSLSDVSSLSNLSNQSTPHTPPNQPNDDPGTIQKTLDSGSEPPLNPAHHNKRPVGEEEGEWSEQMTDIDKKRHSMSTSPPITKKRKTVVFSESEESD